MTEPITGLVLAGGKSRRFGSDKASALLAGRPLLQWVASTLAEVCGALVVVSARGQQLPAFDVAIPVTVVEDLYEGKGPLAGLVTGFAAAGEGVCFATSCDAPLLRPELVLLLAAAAEGHDIACPYVNGFLQPLVAAYRAETCLPVFRDFVEREQLKITPAFGPLDAVIVREPQIRTVDPELESFLNANQPEALEDIAARLASRSLPSQSPQDPGVG